MAGFSVTVGLTGRESPERMQSLCSLLYLAWRAGFTDSVPHSLIHLSDFSLIHSFTSSFTHFPLYTHYIHSSVHTPPYTHLHLLRACKTLANLRGRIAALARVTQPPCGQLTRVQAWGPKKPWGRGRHTEEPRNWQLGSRRSVPPAGPHARA